MNNFLMFMHAPLSEVYVYFPLYDKYGDKQKCISPWVYHEFSMEKAMPAQLDKNRMICRGEAVDLLEGWLGPGMRMSREQREGTMTKGPRRI